VNFTSNWWDKAALEGHLHLGLPSPTWLWLLNNVIAYLYLNECWKDAPTKTDCGTICFEAQKTHFTAWIWVIKGTSLIMLTHFSSRSDLTSWKESIEKNTEHTTRRLLLQAMRCVSGRLDSFHKFDNSIYLKGMFQLEASLWLIGNLEGGQN